MLDETLLDYWVRSQRLRSLQTPQAKETYRKLQIEPAVERETDPRRKSLLQRLLAA